MLTPNPYTHLELRLPVHGRTRNLSQGGLGEPQRGVGGCSFWSQGLTEDRNKARVRGQSGANVSLGIGLRMELGVRLGWGQPKDRN